MPRGVPNAAMSVKGGAACCTAAACAAKLLQDWKKIKQGPGAAAVHRPIDPSFAWLAP
jgi:hypothetical protein